MNNTIIKHDNRYVVRAFIVIVGGAVIIGAGLFSFRHHDITLLGHFIDSYTQFDKAMADVSTPIFGSNPQGSHRSDVDTTNNLEQKASDALIKLNAASMVRISSATKYDSELMRLELDIADEAKQELNALRAYNKALLNKTDLDRTAKEYRVFHNNRTAAYALFQERSGITN